MSVGSPTTQPDGLHAGAREILDETADADAADFLVVREREMQRLVEARHVLRQQRERDRDEALHVGGAAAVEPAVLLDERERIAVPRLAVDRHDVGVAGEHEPAVAARAQRREEIRLAPVVVEREAHVRVERGAAARARNR